MPLLIAQVIKVIDPTADHSGLLFDSPYSYGVAYFAMAVLSNLASYAGSSILVDTRIQMRSALIGAVYRKTFRLSLAARTSTSPGSINSFADADTRSIGMLPDSVIRLITCLLQIVLAIFFLAQSLGVSTWVTAGVYVVLGVAVALLSPYLVAAEDKYLEFMDKRISLLRELLQGMRTLKLEAAERVLGSAIDAIRSDQLVSLVKLNKWQVPLIVFLIIQQDALPSIAIASFHLFGGTITAASVFTILGFLDALQGPSGSLEWVVSAISSSIPSIRRISAFLAKEESDPRNVTTTRISPDSKAPDAIVMHAATFAFEALIPAEDGEDDAGDDAQSTHAEPFELTDLSLVIPRGSLVVVVGSVGSGKSSFLSALVGSMTLRHGTSAVNGSVAYCPQTPFIMSGTIENNIRGFAGRATAASVFDAVEATCLDRDISVLPDGLSTRIGERGISLSGGQKARVALARAIACDPDVLVLDDPLAALDASVGRTVLEETVLGRLKGKTVILATHDLRVASRADIVLVFEKGTIVEMGTAAKLRKLDGQGDKEHRDTHRIKAEDDTTLPLTSSVDPDVVTATLTKEVLDAVANFETSQVVAEDRRIGSVQLSVYRSYFSTAGYTVSAIPFLLLPIGIAADAALQISLVLWSSDSLGWTDNQYFTGFYCLGLARTGMALVTGWSCMLMCYYASRAYHRKALEGILNAPVQWFDHQPVGRILNRFSSDISALDTDLFPLMDSTFVCVISVFSSVVVLAFGSPYMLLLLAGLAVPSTYLFGYFQTSYRELKRLQSTLQSPLSAHLSESFDGIATIGIYGWVEAFVERQEVVTDLSNKAPLLMSTAEFWLHLRLALLSSLIILVTLMLAGAGFISSSAAGLMLVSAIGISGHIRNALEHFSRVEAIFNAVERLDHYASDLPSEISKGSISVPLDWPLQGAIIIRDLTLAYDATTPVIKNVSLSIPAGQHIALCGRTGSGKSTLCAALFRLMTPVSGSIAIDGVDIADIDLHTLRSRLMIIPQDPVLSSGTLRANLDRHGKYPDSDIWHALDLAGLHSHVSTLPGKLDHPVTSSTSLSSGQRQLLFMAKAILRAPHIRILVLDESTASVDAAADDRIGKLVKEKFSHATVVCVAHRLSTVAGMQRVVVMSDGKVVETGTPWELLGKDESVFKGMVECTGPENAQAIREVAKRGLEEGIDA
ncbi:P-loop containing nucleoside triphosphate hydrolase protein [Fimicolochytrium jonesii]|uniref:P-loop containing nucleoside triphosphate hydrolase protein n=1 Tax=Fimicolochytrium jonesii TaxID=1396493 RepID=UPI0022FE0807|nr:P-loop containing nucleoside triphosphate hydrolase protein [Fimicolochytrium jonesii]KAI8823189.1 P-loop containing nucleoside triphosphate hydrolase protein [Fimicolochytrium jonesii]